MEIAESITEIRVNFCGSAVLREIIMAAFCRSARVAVMPRNVFSGATVRTLSIATVLRGSDMLSRIPNGSSSLLRQHRRVSLFGLQIWWICFNSPFNLMCIIYIQVGM